MAGNLMFNLLSTVTVLLVIVSLSNYSEAGRSRRFNCGRCYKVCGKDLKKNEALTFCNQCSVICDVQKIRKDPWLKLTNQIKQRFNATAQKVAVEEETQTESALAGRSMNDKGAPKNSGKSWWGRR